MIPAQISGEALGALLAVLGRVISNDGHLDGESIWFTSKEETYGCHATPSDRFEEEKNVLRTHKKTLLQLRKSLEIRMSEVEKAINTNFRMRKNRLSLRIATLPFEVLSRIFIFAHQTRFLLMSNQRSVTISHVCRRFRSVAIQTPELWTVVLCSHSIAETKEFLRRSGSRPLTVVCDMDDGPELEDFMDVIVPHSLRWAELCIYVDNLSLGNQTAFSLSSYHPRLELPMLTTLRQEVYQAHSSIVSDHFSKASWHMPKLTNFTSVNVTPCDGDRFQWLKSCELRWDYMTGKEFPALIGCLGSMHSLETLGLHFNYVKQVNQEINSDRIYELPSITKLTLRVDGGNGIETVVEELFDRVKLPNVIEVDMDLDLCNSWCHGMPMCLSMPTGPICFENLHRLRVKFTDTIVYDPKFIIEMFHKCNSLVELSIHTPTIALFGATGEEDDLWPSYLPLQRLCLDRCDVVSQVKVAALVNALRRGPNWRTFENLHIARWSKLSEDFLLTIEDILEGKSTWVTP